MNQINLTQQQFDDEIELIDYSRVLWKWKWLIIVGSVVCMVVTGVISFRMPNVYKVFQKHLISSQ